jgi:molybdopterin-guanine dinucleotide biosynthesis adapter protein
MIPIISIVGWSGSGKTTLLEKLIPELVRRGYRVATAKHNNNSYELDQEGKDTWRHRQAGAFCTVISSPKQMALFQGMDRDLTLEEIRERYIRDADILIAEGFKRDSAPKVEVFRSGAGEHTAPIFLEPGVLVALVSDRRFDTDAPCLGLDDVTVLATIIEEKFLKGRKP